jgi:hypothetical protein
MNCCEIASYEAKFRKTSLNIEKRVHDFRSMFVFMNVIVRDLNSRILVLLGVEVGLIPAFYC